MARSWGDANMGPGDQIVITEMEHHANMVPWQQFAERVGAVLDWAPFDGEGLLDLGALRAARTRPEAACRRPVSNVLGTDNPLPRSPRWPRGRRDGARRRRPGGAEAAARRAALGVDFFAITGHKIYGPTGVGMLWGRLDLLRAMPPFLGGGSMIRKVTARAPPTPMSPARFEAGTPAIAQAIGMGAALHSSTPLGMEAVRDTNTRSPTTPWSALAEVPGLKFFGPPRGPERLGPVSFEIDGIHAHDVSEILDRHGIAVRAGHHCAQVADGPSRHHRHRPRHFGVYTTTAEIDRLVDGLEDARRVFGAPAGR